MLIDWVCGNERFRLHLVCTSGPRAKYLKFLSGPPVRLRGTYYGVHKCYDFDVFVVVILVLKVKKWHPFCSREWMNLRRVNLFKPVSFFNFLLLSTAHLFKFVQENLFFKVLLRSLPRRKVEKIYCEFQGRVCQALSVKQLKVKVIPLFAASLGKGNEQFVIYNLRWC